MRRFAISRIVVAALALLALPVAIAADPDVDHFEFSDTFSDGDSCGTGRTVDISAAGHATEFFARNQPVEYRQAIEGKVLFTNPLNGKTRFGPVQAPRHTKGRNYET